MKKTALVLRAGIGLLVTLALCPPFAVAFAATPPPPVLPIPTTDRVQTVAVAGATGRCGRLVVEELLSRGVQVLALVRDEGKASETLDTKHSLLTVKECNLGKPEEIESLVKGHCDAAVWCATGFSDAPGSSVWAKVKKLVGIAIQPKKSIDAIGVPALADCFKTASRDETAPTPKVVMLSSAGVTRTTWDGDKKEKLTGVADIPIVRLNPFGILDIKRESEEKLRESGVDYCIVRPAGLNDKWPAGSRTVVSQGDVAAGRINRRDVASLLVNVLSAPEATGKTFEAIGLMGYPPATSIGPALAKLRLDRHGPPSLEEVSATYAAMQQLLPGETQDSAGLAMGQTYEQLDKKEVGRLGKRGEEDLAAIPTRPSST